MLCYVMFMVALINFSCFDVVVFFLCLFVCLFVLPTYRGLFQGLLTTGRSSRPMTETMMRGHWATARSTIITVDGGIDDVLHRRI